MTGFVQTLNLTTAFQAVFAPAKCLALSRGLLKQVLWLTPLIFLYGCPRPSPLPVESMFALPPQQAAKHYSALNDAAGSLRTLRALLHVTAETRLARRSFSQSVVISLPDKLRIDVFVSEFQHLAQLILIRDGIVTTYNPEKREITRQAFTQEGLASIFGLPLNIEQLANWLRGKYRPLHEPVSTTIWQHESERRYALIEETINGKIAVLFHYPQNQAIGAPQINAIEIRDDGGYLVLKSRFLYGEKQVSAQHQLPKQILLEHAKDGYQAVIDFGLLRENPELHNAEQLFHIRAPKGTRLVN